MSSFEGLFFYYKCGFVVCQAILRMCECVARKHLTKPLTVKLLDMSREYWLSKNVSDWRVVIDEEK